MLFFNNVSFIFLVKFNGLRFILYIYFIYFIIYEGDVEYEVEFD